MAGRVYLETLTKTFTPAAVGTTQTANIFAVKKGDRIVAVALRKVVLSAGTTSTVLIATDAGAGSGALMAATPADGGAVGDVVNGAGAGLANSGGFLCTGDGNIIATYTIGATPGAVNPSVRINVEVIRNRGQL